MMEKPNILLLLSDEHSFRYMGHVPDNEGGEPVATPTFDWLASNGVRFTDAYCQVALCTPSRMCLLTGLEARRCGGWWNESVLRPELPTLPATLSASGYETCLVGKMHLGGTNQFAGFQHRPYGDLTGHTGHQLEPLNRPDIGEYEMRFRTANAGVTEIPESQMQERIACEEGLAFLREHTHANPVMPWFLCLSFSRPHFPLTSPSRHFDKYWPAGVTRPRVGATGDAFNHPMSVGMRRGFRTEEISDHEMMRARAGYFGCVSFLDEIVGDFLVRLQSEHLLDNTVVIYTSDHGEMAGEHGAWWKQGWYEACTRIPMIISTPDHRRSGTGGRSYRSPVALIDLVPTIYSLAGVDVPHAVDGEDLGPAVFNETDPANRPIVSDNLMPRWGKGTEYRMVRWGRYKYVHFRDAPKLLFDLESDPDEQVNLAAERDTSIREVLDRFTEFVDNTMDFEEAERERTGRDGSLKEVYQLPVPEGRTNRNLYLMPSGRMVSAEDMLYNPNVIIADPDSVLIGKPGRRAEVGDENKES